MRSIGWGTTEGAGNTGVTLILYNDFIADLIALFEVEEKSETHPELKEVLKPMFETWQGKKFLKSLSDREMKDMLVQAKSLCLDKLLRWN